MPARADPAYHAGVVGSSHRRLAYRVVAFVLALSACVTPYGSREDAEPGGSGTEGGGPSVDELRQSLADIPIPPRIDPADRPAAPASRRRLRRFDVEEVLASLSLRDRIGQRFVAWLDGRPTRAQMEDLADWAVPAGFILYPWNYTSQDDVRRLTGTARSVVHERIPGMRPLIMVDQEGGRVRALRFEDLVQLPSAFQLAALDDPDFMRSVSFVNGVHMMDLGVNMNLAPVLDLYGMADRTIIGDRSMGDDPLLVSRQARAYVDGAREAGLIVTGKHFPGHGVSTVDSHGSLPVVDLDMDDLRRRELVPFAAAIDAGIDVIMTAHILFTRIDPEYPVTLSPIFLQDLLREEMGFEGLVISDGLEMGALSRNFGIRETLERSIIAGVDLILLYTRYDFVEMVTLVEEMVADGTISEEQIDAGTRRVLELKARYGLLDLPARDEPER